MAGIDNKISNIIGTKIPKYIYDQLIWRSEKGSEYSRDTNNLLFLANKSAWVRLVSSVNLSKEDIRYFNNAENANKKYSLPITLTNPDDLAKNYVLFGGTSKYLPSEDNKSFKYDLRSGIGPDKAYGILGNSEIRDFGYRPMPGIIEASIETQGRLGSVRSATINFKCWDKYQLDIMDALYFKLGFSMFLEWGHTVYYKANDNNIKQYSELLSINPFEEGLTKEAIQEKISKNNRESEGNYDGMLGIVTNFNYSYNQEGGFDCTVKLMSLGILGDRIKVNNTGILPALLENEIKEFTNVLKKIEIEKLRKENAGKIDTGKTDTGLTGSLLSNSSSFEDVVNKFKNEKKATFYYPSNVSNEKEADVIINQDNNKLIYGINRLNKFIAISPDNISKTGIELDTTKPQFKEFENLVVQGTNWNDTQDRLNLDYRYSGSNGVVYQILVSRDDSLIARINEADLKTQLKSQASEIKITDDSEGFWKDLFSNNNNEVKITEEEIKKAAAEYFKGFSSFSARNFTLYSNNAYLSNFLLYNIAKGNKPIKNFTFYVELKIPRKIQVTETFAGRWGTKDTNITNKTVNYTYLLPFVVQDSFLFSNVKTDPSVDQPIDNIDNQRAIQAQNQKEAEAKKAAEEAQKAQEDQIKVSISTLSNLELSLKSIQLKAFNEAIKSNNTTDLSTLSTINIKKFKIYENKDFYNAIFSNGVFSNIIGDLISRSGNISDSDQFKNYINDNKAVTEADRLFVQSAYGFTVPIMKNRLSAEEIKNLNPVFFKDILNAYVVPYQMNQEIVKGTQVNNPVYIPFGLLLMLINHSAIIYDKKSDVLKPLVYIDFNPDHNFLLSNIRQLSTNPWKVLIPCEAKLDDFKSLFEDSILEGNSIQGGTETESTSIFLSDGSDNALSNQLELPFRYDAKQYNKDTSAFRGRIMHILLNVDYLTNLARDFAAKDENNSVYLKPFLDQILDDINKYMGNINFLRLAYNDGANTYQIVDDQIIPTDDKEKTISPKDPSNSYTLPLVGTKSIAKNLEVKTEISSKLANMIAISANANLKDKAGLSTSGDNNGYINLGYFDRYIPNRIETTGSKNTTSLKNAAVQFNSAIRSFYSSTQPSQNNVDQATNYYIQNMIRTKNEDFATRASAMIPVSVNFTTNGISGLNMGQAFTVPDEVLPYTYNLRAINERGLGADRVKKVGFIIFGLNHTISQNTWDTTIRANMTFLKDIGDYNASVQELKNEGRAYTNQNTAVSTDCGCSRCYRLSYPTIWDPNTQKMVKQYSCANQVEEPDSINTNNFGNGRKYYGDYTFKKGTSDIDLSKAGLTPLTESEIIDDTTQNRFLLGTISTNTEERRFIVHHTAGAPGSAKSVYDVFYGRGLPAQYVIDGNGKIHRFMPDGAKGWHAGPNYNSKSIGVEIAARNNDQVSDAQAKAAVRLIHYLGFRKDQVLGHGQISSKKQPTEGAKVVNLIKTL